jgi:dolichol-phosphate mannosyltransferase
MKIAIVIPCFKVKAQILAVIAAIPEGIHNIYVIDDKCPEESGAFVLAMNFDDRVKVIFNSMNKGVGGAVIAGYRAALEDDCDIVVKVDGDGQMNPRLIFELIEPILTNKADYTKGNRFHSPEFLKSMPWLRLLGNSVLSLINKFVTGYWNIMDPTNGFTAINNRTLKSLELEKIHCRYFFESDMLYNLSIIRAVVIDYPMKSVYDNEISNLNIKKVMLQFPPMYLKRFIKRIFYLYFLRDFNIGTIQLVFGVLLFFFGLFFGSVKWFVSMETKNVVSSGTVMLSALPIILGFQLLLSALNYDINSLPRKA